MPRVEKLAQILVDHSAEIQPGDRVAIEAATAAEPLVRGLVRDHPGARRVSLPAAGFA